MKIECIPTGFLNTNCYIVTGAGYVMVIDPGDNSELILDNLPLSPTSIFLTHTHFDHVGALNGLKEKFPLCPVYVHEQENTTEDFVLETAGRYIAMRLKRHGFTLPPDITKVPDGFVLNGFEVIHTPGHTMGSACLYNKEEKVLFSGDTLFYHTWGRTDLGGDDRSMRSSLEKLLKLDLETTVYPGHGGQTKIKEELHLLG